MYDVYQHVFHPSYRVIVLRGVPIPNNAKKSDWRFVRSVDRVWEDADKEIKELGYHLYRVDFQFSEIP